MITFNRLHLEDFGPYREAELPLANQGLVLIKADNRDSTAADSNGSGKSHLFKALAWCLFGDTLEGDKTDEVVRKGAKVAKVEVEFSDGSHSYIVARTRNKATGNVALFQDDVDISGIVAKDTQAKILSLIGLDFVTFTNTVLYGQGDVNHFADPKTKDPERKAIMKKILRMEVLDGALGWIKTKLAVLNSEKVALTNRLPVLKARMESLDTSLVESRIATLETRRKDAAKVAAKKPRLLKAKQQIEQLLKDYETKKKEITKLQNDQRALEAKVSMERFAGAGAKQKVDTARKRLALFKGGKCPTCTTPTTSEHILSELSVINAEIADGEEKLKVAEATQVELQKDADAHKASVREAEREIADERDWRSQLVTVSGELFAAESADRQLKTVDADIKKEQAALKEAEHQMKTLASEEEEANKKILELDEEIRHLEFWQRGFGNQGMPSFVMDSIIPSLNDRTNQFLRILSDGDITVDFDTVSMLKSGEARDKFSITPTIEGMVGTRASTGQQKKINIAADVALMTILADRERSGIDMLLLDEVLDGLDKSGKARVIDLLLELRKSRSTIFVVSHDEGLEAIFEKTITVVKEGGVARLEM